MSVRHSAIIGEEGVRSTPDTKNPQEFIFIDLEDPPDSDPKEIIRVGSEPPDIWRRRRIRSEALQCLPDS